jgi:hypothetical protein
MVTKGDFGGHIYSSRSIVRNECGSFVASWYIFIKVSSAVLSPGFLSGWNFNDNLRYAFLIIFALVPVSIPRMVYGSNVKTSPSCLTRVIKYNIINETITNNIKNAIKSIKLLFNKNNNYEDDDE